MFLFLRISLSKLTVKSMMTLLHCLKEVKPLFISSVRCILIPYSELRNIAINGIIKNIYNFLEEFLIVGEREREMDALR